MGRSCASILVLSTLLTACASDTRRPIYNIAHMVNSVAEIQKNLDRGANMLEADIQFYANGSVKEVYHGFPCDFGRFCENRANLKEYLDHVRTITDPSTTPKNYADQMIMQYFDCKLSDKINLREAGRDLARHVLDFLWDGKRKQEVRVLVYIDSVAYNDTIEGFREEFKHRRQKFRLNNVGFDGGSGKIGDIQRMFASLGVEDNIWIGDGTTNFFSALYPDVRLREEIKIRDNTTSLFKKVYHWTIDFLPRWIESLDLGVDGFITNLPHELAALVRGPLYKDTCRLATPDDNPFEKYDVTSGTVT